MQATVNNATVTVPEASALIPPSISKKVPLNGERLDNAAFVMLGDNLEYPTVMQKNNIGFMYDVPSNKKLAVW